MTERVPSPNAPPGACVVTVEGERLVLHPDRGVYWPRRKTLFIADVHLGKATTFRTEGIALPSGTMERDLNRLSRLVSRLAAGRLVVLGDLFHAAAGMDDRTLCRVRTWRAAHQALDVVLVRGNHDRSAGPTPQDLRIDEVEPPLEDAPFALVHDPAAPAQRLKLCGHLHPGIRLHTATWSERLPCFYLQRKALVLPAFTEFAGLQDIAPRREEKVFAVADDAVVRVV